VRLFAHQQDRALRLAARPDRIVEHQALSTATTTLVISLGTPDTSMIEIGLPSPGRRKMLAMKLAIVSDTSMPLNMKL
jgi:hypothetical protein